MKVPSFSRHSGPTATRDDNRDGVPGNPPGGLPDRPRAQADDRLGFRSGPAYPGDEPTTQRIRTGRDDTRDDLPRVPASGSAAVPEHQPGDGRDRTPPPVAGPRPRASLLATLSLIVGVAAALFVVSGALAGYGIALGAFAVVLALGGIWATRRRHVAGKSDALLGLILGLGAMALGVLAFTGALSWLGTDTDTVGQLRQWLDAQFVDRF